MTLFLLVAMTGQSKGKGEFTVLQWNVWQEGTMVPGGYDAIVNEINAATVDVILSMMPSPKQEHFLVHNRGKMSAILWYGVGNCKFSKKKYNLWNAIQKRIRIYKLENHINKYEKQGE